MASLISKKIRVDLKVPGVCYAREIQWIPINRFVLEIRPDYVLELFQPGSDYYAKYHGPTTVSVSSLYFTPSTFHLYKNVAGLTSNEYNVEPFHRKINYSGSQSEQAFRALFIREKYQNFKALRH